MLNVSELLRIQYEMDDCISDDVIRRKGMHLKWAMSKQTIKAFAKRYKIGTGKSKGTKQMLLGNPLEIDPLLPSETAELRLCKRTEQ